MLRHRGKRRTFTHNLRLAAMLSFVAGMVNICGVLAVNTLTTNVTGHFAFFAEQLVLKNFGAAFTFLLFILAFLAGAFTASLLTELMRAKKPHVAHVLPILLEIFLLMWVASGLYRPDASAALASVMLFSMGVQNSLVTSISSSVVRTTHLTGLFTDLGIELSELVFYRAADDQRKLRKSIALRSSIIFCFLGGGVTGGLLYSRTGIQALYCAVVVLLAALAYDAARYRFLAMKRSVKM